MQFSCAKHDLERAAVIAERFTGKQHTLPVLGSVLLTADARGLTLAATNLEHAAQLRVPARVSREGRAAVPSKIFSSLLQSLGDTDIEAEGHGGNLVLRTDAREGRIRGVPADDFPLIPKVKKTAGFSADAARLAAGLSRVLPAVSLSEFKPELSGVFFRAGKDTVTLCATDTFRLAEAVVPLAASAADAAPPFILPHRAAQELSRLLDGETGTVSLALGDNQVAVEAGGGEIVSRLVEGAFPDYQAIIPGKFSTSLYFSRDEAIRGIRAASIFASKLQEVTLQIGGKHMDIKAANADVGEYHTRHPAAHTGKDVSMSFNWRYVLDGLQALEDDEIFFGCNEASSPAMLRNKSNAGFTYVVMPIRLT